MKTFLPAQASRLSRAVSWGVAVLMLAIAVPAVLLLLGPRSIVYDLQPDTLVVEASLSGWDQGRVLDRAAVTDARATETNGGTRYRGTGMPDFCQGVWGHRGLGEVWQATTCGSEVVVLRFSGEDRPVMLSPDDRDGFLQALAQGETGRFPATEAAPGGGVPTWLFILGLLTVLGTVGLLGVMKVSPGRLKYEVSDRTLTVVTLFGRKPIPLAGAKIERTPRARPTLRLFGIGLPGHHMGLYRVQGKTVRIYASRFTDVVWISPRGERDIIVSPEDVDGFLAAVQG
jgi:hypothetical protein